MGYIKVGVSWDYPCNFATYQLAWGNILQGLENKSWNRLRRIQQTLHLLDTNMKTWSTVYCKLHEKVLKESSHSV